MSSGFSSVSVPDLYSDSSTFTSTPASSSSDTRALLQVALQNAQCINGGINGGVLPPMGFFDPSTKHARKIYVGNLPIIATEPSLMAFFNEALESLLPNRGPGQPIVSCYLNLQRRFAFLEHRSIREANFTLGLDGIQYAGHALKLRRPQDYNAALAEAQMKMEEGGESSVPSADPTPSIPQGDLVAGALGIISTTVDDSPNKVFIGGLPHHLTETEVKQILVTFGPLKSFHLVKGQPMTPGETEKSKGFAFCEWRDSALTDYACESLNGLRLGERTLNVRRAVPHAVHKASALGVTPQQAVAMGLTGTHSIGVSGSTGTITSMGAFIDPSVVPQQSSIGRVSRIISIKNMLKPEVTDPQVIDEALAEAENECGAVAEIRSVNYVQGQILTEFATTADAVKALKLLQGKLFDDRILQCAFAEATPEIRTAAVKRIIGEATADYEYYIQQRHKIKKATEAC